MTTVLYTAWNLLVSGPSNVNGLYTICWYAVDCDTDCTPMLIGGPSNVNGFVHCMELCLLVGRRL